MSISETFHQKSISTTLLRRCDLSRNLYRNGEISQSPCPFEMTIKKESELFSISIFTTSSRSEVSRHEQNKPAKNRIFPIPSNYVMVSVSEPSVTHEVSSINNSYKSERFIATYRSIDFALNRSFDRCVPSG